MADMTIKILDDDIYDKNKRRPHPQTIELANRMCKSKTIKLKQMLKQQKIFLNFLQS